MTRAFDTSPNNASHPLLAALRALCLAGVACSSLATAQTFPVSGVVLDALTQTAVPRVELTLTQSAANVDFTTATTSDEQGRFRFNPVPGGKYYLSAKRTGYANQLLNQREGFSTLVVAGPNLD